MKLRIKFCPKCKSENISININTLTATGVPSMHKCEDCGYKGYIIFEKEIKLNKKKK